MKEKKDEKKFPLVVIAGPTASGKTELAIELAKKLNGEIISADSRQIYRYMDIASAKPTKQQLKKVTHHLIDVVNPNEHFSVAKFKEMAENLIKKINKKKKTPFVVGGTGLYIKALIEGLFPSPSPSKILRLQLQQEAEELGNHYLHQKLKQVDEEAAARIHPNDRKRIIRALEVYYQTQKGISQLQRFETKKLNYKSALVLLDIDRKKLYERIEKRVDQMIQEGLIDETKKLLEMGYDKDLISMECIGYKHIICYLKNEISLEDAISLIKRDTRRYAKRQLTWFRAKKYFKRFQPEQFEEIYDFIKEKLEIFHQNN
jgi:tRNA dimethylallyltransferase